MNTFLFAVNKVLYFIYENKTNKYRSLEMSTIYPTVIEQAA
jgi:hypothetical protein